MRKRKRSLTRIMSEGSAEARITAKPKDSKKSKDNQQPSDEDGSPDNFSAFSLFPVTRVLTEPGQDTRLEEYDYKGAKKLRNLNMKWKNCDTFAMMAGFRKP